MFEDRLARYEAHRSHLARVERRLARCAGAVISTGYSERLETERTRALRHVQAVEEVLAEELRAARPPLSDEIVTEERTESKGRKAGNGAPDAAGNLHVLGHDGLSLGVDGTHLAVVKQVDDGVLSGLLEGEQGRPGPSKGLGSDIVGDLPDESSKGQLGDEQVDGTLVIADLPKRHSPRFPSLRCGWCT
jgi:hypothetical protein